MSPAPDSQRYRNLFEQAPEAHLVLDRAGHVVAANQAACRLFHCADAGELDGRSISALDMEASPDDVRRVHENPAHHLPARFETRMRRPDGSHFPAEVRTRAVEHDDDIEVFTTLRDITGQRISEQTLHDLESQLEVTVANAPLILFSLDADGYITLSEGAGLYGLGLNNHDLVGVNAFERWADHPQVPQDLRRALAGEHFASEFDLDGRRLNISWTPTADPDGVISGVIGVAYDLTDLRVTERHLEAERDRLSTTLESLADGVITTDADGRIQYINPAAEALLDVDRANVLDADADRTIGLLEPGQDSATPLAARCLRWGRPLEYPEGRLEICAGPCHVRATVSPLGGATDGDVTGAVIVLQDMTALSDMTSRLNHQATHDDLTELFNRREFERRVESALSIPGRHRTPHVLCYMDLDQFKIVNDTCGHLAGDALLQRLAELLPRHIRESDTLARLGGDEFGLLLNHCPVERAQEIAEEIIDTVRDLRFEWEGRRFDIGVSIGLVPVYGAQKDLNILLSQADSACYAAKETGRNTVYLWREGDDRLRQRHGEMEWVGRIRDALEQARFVPFAQPIQRLDPAAGHSLDHFEVLVRLQDEQGELIAPGAFIPAAERYHLMPEIDRHVIEAVLIELTTHPDDSIPVAINLSGQSLAQPEMLDFIADRLSHHGIAPRRVTFEITETAAISNHDQAISLIRALRYLGCHFSLDDFGSGLSSFGYLKKLSVDFLKIDGSFVRGIAQDPVDAAMVTAIHRVGRVLGLHTIAEGVEDAEGMERLRAIGLDCVQGYHIARPRPLRDCLQDLLTSS
ncbi:bifunctional diguanylate cyclase/phosphodiesterase [Thioalkalivibrio sp. AKL17]|uniref:bifunctional diguanylate cyclase/phosphodiesterase n=1 Tax=Thioalkalivibrio sp. AKL17 TaxID=1158160 RepID=UPI0003653CEE|nr:EAL domain-containing protein [Thioalkalivibrio sp. AKL17]